jgi:hypothetical protein
MSKPSIKIPKKKRTNKFNDSDDDSDEAVKPAQKKPLPAIGGKPALPKIAEKA